MTDYNKQAKDFLQATETTLEIIEAVPQKIAKWAKKDKDSEKHTHYVCTLKNNHHSYTFDFWGSVNDWEKIDAFRNMQRLSFMQKQADYKRKDILKEDNLFIDWRKMIKKEDREKYIKEKLSPTEYDILACLSPMYEDNFDDFCASFGYDTNSMTAHEIYQACIEQDRNLRKLFNREELEKLSDIQL